MQIVSHCPIPTSSVLWQPRVDRWIYTVICKATFLLRPGLSPLAPTQEPPSSADVYWDNDERRGLLSTSDVIPFKRFPEVIFTGSACAPGGVPVTSLRVRLAIGSVDKVIEVVGDRFLARSGELSPPIPFGRMPLSWERAAGGPGTLNPVGVRTGAASIPDDRGRIIVPNLYLPGCTIAGPRDVIDPVGLSPIAPGWPPRVARLPEHARGWNSHCWSEQPLPVGFDPWFFNAAPEDQQLAELQGGERLLLEHLHPDHPRLETTLERLALHAIVDRGNGAPANVELRCDALIIYGDRGRATLTWRGHVPLDHPQRTWSVFITLDRPSGAEEALEAEVETTLNIGLVQAAGASVLPFRAPDPDAAPRLSSPAQTPAPPSASAGHTVAAALVATGSPLPFQAPGNVELLNAYAPLETAPPPSPSQSQPQATLAVPLVDGSARTPLPFSAPGRRPGDDAPGAPVVLPSEERPVELAYAPLPAPPPMLGPLAAQEMRAGPAPDEEHSEGGAAAQAPSTKSVPAEPRPDVVDVPLERYAAIQASIHRRGDEKEQILKENEMAAEVWARIEQRWEDALDAEIDGGRTDLLQRFDSAYVAQLEKERGEIQAEEYALLVVSAERGTTEQVLKELSLPEEAEMPVERIWLEKITSNPVVGRRVRQAVNAAQQK